MCCILFNLCIYHHRRRRRRRRRRQHIAPSCVCDRVHSSTDIPDKPIWTKFHIPYYSIITIPTWIAKYGMMTNTERFENDQMLFTI